MNTLLRFLMLSFLCAVAAFPIFLIAGRLGISLGYCSQVTVFGVLKASGAVAMFSGCLGLLLWRTNL